MSVVNFCRSFLELDRCYIVLANKVNLANKVMVEMNTFRRFSLIVPSDLFVFFVFCFDFPKCSQQFSSFSYGSFSNQQRGMGPPQGKGMGGQEPSYCPPVIKQRNGKSLMNGDFNRKITYKWYGWLENPPTEWRFYLRKIMESMVHFLASHV